MATRTDRRAKAGTLLPFLLVFLVVSVLLSLGIGAVHVPLSQTPAVLVSHLWGGPGGGPAAEAIVWGLRLPRVLLAASGGAVLALAGVLMQTLTRNPVAEPYVLGLSSGASAGAVWIIIFGGLPWAGGWAVQLGAFAGAVLSLAVVLSLAGKRPSALRLVLLGLGVGAFFSALTAFTLCEAHNDSELRSAMFWMLGSFSTARLADLPPVLLALAAGVVGTLAAHKELDGLLLGDGPAASLGIPVRPVRIGAALTSALVVALLVSKTGVVGFVGLLAPHLARRLVGPGHKGLTAVALPLGAIILVWGDTLARTVYAPQELPVGVLTSLVGAPLFVWLVQKDYSFGGQS